MTCNERFKRLKDATSLTFDQLAEIFGVNDVQTVQGWYTGRFGMSPDFRATLLRLEADNLPRLSPKLRPETVAAFNEGRKRRA
jgi:hypothetical protein